MTDTDTPFTVNAGQASAGYVSGIADPGCQHGYYYQNEVTGRTFVIDARERSEWRCHLFGTENMTLQPFKGDEPNWFWRKMQYLAFGNRWVKEK